MLRCIRRPASESGRAALWSSLHTCPPPITIPTFRRSRTRTGVGNTTGGAEAMLVSTALEALPFPTEGGEVASVSITLKALPFPTSSGCDQEHSASVISDEGEGVGQLLLWSFWRRL